MGKTIRHQQAIYLDHDKAKLLDKLAARTRLPKQVLLRDAVDLLLAQHKLLKPARKP
jgi:Ribbon-helix-helix domain